MNEHKRTLPAAVLMMVFSCLCLVWFHYSSHYVRINHTNYAMTVTELDLSGAPVEQMDNLGKLPLLRRLDLRGTGITAEEYVKIAAEIPECEILWDVPFQGGYLAQDRKVLNITSLTEEDIAALDYLPQLQLIKAWGCTDYDALMALMARRPEVTVHYTVEICGESYNQRTASLKIPGDKPEELEKLLKYLPNLKSVTLVEPLAEVEAIRQLQAAYPAVDIRWQLDIGGVTADEFTTTLDLTGVPMTVARMEALIPYMPNLTYVDMTDCGIANEQMDQLNRKYEDIKIVWTVSIGRYLRVKTDITWFMPVKYDVYVRTADCYNLRYCTDVIALDIGHMPVTNCDFVAFMPHLKYLLLADTDISDLTPLTGLTELIYLELFLTHVRDYSPLLTLTSLEDLNLHYTRGDASIIAQMTWLKNLWWYNKDNIYPTWSEREMLRQALPNTRLEFFCESSTGGGWRQLPNYYAQRDIFGMRYMK